GRGGAWDAVGAPPEESARRVVPGVLGGEVGRRRTETGSGRAVAPPGDAVAGRALGAINSSALDDGCGGVGGGGPHGRRWGRIDSARGKRNGRAGAEGHGPRPRP